MLAKHAENIARVKLNQPSEWKAFRWEMLDKTICKVSGGIPKITKKKKETWYGVKPQTAYVHISEIETEKTRYIIETGNCAECFGEGKEFAGWSIDEGARYRDCSMCKGTGLKLK